MLITPQQRKTLLDALTQRFSTDELKEIAFNLGAEWDNLDGDTRREKAIALTIYGTNTRTLDQLIAAIKAARPDIQL